MSFNKLVFLIALLPCLAFGRDDGPPRISIRGQVVDASTSYGVVIANVATALTNAADALAFGNAHETILTLDRAAHYFYAGPASGPDGTPSWRLLVGSDIPASATSSSLAFSNGTNFVFMPKLPNALLSTGIDALNIGAGLVSNAELALLDGKTSLVEAEADTLQTVTGRGNSTTLDMTGKNVQSTSYTQSVYGFQTTGAVAGSVAGNTRATTSTDLQVARDAATQVASGPWSTITGGRFNTASGYYSFVGGGDRNTASSDACVVGGGFDNICAAPSGTIAGGHSNLLYMVYGTIGGGLSNRLGDSISDHGNYAVIGGGEANKNIGLYGVIGGGHLNTVTGQHANVIGGLGNHADKDYETVAGSYNSTATTNLLFALGNGTSNVARSNAFSVNSSGDTTMQGVWESQGTTTNTMAGNLTVAGNLAIGGGDPIKKHITKQFANQEITCGGGPAYTEISLTVSGAAPRDVPVVTFDSADDPGESPGTLADAPGMVWSSYVSAADTVKVRIANMDASGIGVFLNVRVDVWKH